MIYIVEDTPKKLSGRSSLFLLSDYNKEIIQVIHELGDCIFDSDTKLWEIPATKLPKLLDNLTYIDDIKLKLLDDEETESEGLKPSLDYKTKPYPYQLEGIEYGLNHNKWLLLDAPGLGKSLQMICLAEELHAKGEVEHCLIICGINTLKSNWKKEIQKHSKLDCVVIGEKFGKNGRLLKETATIAERATKLKGEIKEFFIIINIESLREDKIINAIRKSKTKIDMCVFDEVHKAKESQSRQGRHLLLLNNFKYMVAMTGTLLMNSPLDAFTPLSWIGVDHSNFTEFKNLYTIYGGFGNHDVVGYKNLDILKDELDSCSLRRTKEQVLPFLPKKTIIPETIEMNSDQRRFYDLVEKSVINEASKEIIRTEADKIDIDKTTLLSLVTRLRQATTCPSMLTSEPISVSKLDRCVELVESIVSQGEKVVIMSTFKEPVYELEKRLSAYNPLIGTGDISDSIVSTNVDRFQNEEEFKVFIGTSSKMGTGVTLNAASYMICLDCPWTYAVQQQVEDRIHRANNTRPAFIYILNCADSIDETVQMILAKKRMISDGLIDNVIDVNELELMTNYLLQML